MDTATLARQEQEKQSPLEAEVSFGGEGDLHLHYNDCKKNPGHENFIPVDKFNVEHLPTDYNDKDLIELIRVTSDLTVRVSCKYISEKRPATYSGYNRPYPFSSIRGRKVLIVGTGWVYRVQKYPDEYVNPCATCECRECLSSSAPKTEFAHILIRTAGHIVTDNVEGAHASCCLFYNHGAKPNDCSGVIKLKGISRVWSDTEEDRCRMTYITHDLLLADKLEKLLSQWKNLHQTVETKYAGSGSKDKLVVITSHPHGCSKMISVGNYTSRHENVAGWCQYTYTTATCPGCSGAPVLVLGSRLWQGWFNHVHSGKCEGKEGVNFSALGMDFVSK